MVLLQREVELLEIVQLVGPDALAESERAILAVARMMREDFLQQSAYHDVDRFCPLSKAFWMLKAIMEFHDLTMVAIEFGIFLDQVMSLSVFGDIARMKEIPVERSEGEIKNLMDRVRFSFAEMGVEALVEV
jgi:V/A-type H+-transporting ATPase subunit A